MYARIQNNTAIEVVGFDPVGKFHPDIKWSKVPAGVKRGWTTDGANWSAPVISEPTEPAKALIPIISPVEFKLLFTPQERMAIIAERANDPILDDVYSILDDPRLKEINLNLESNKAIMAYLVGKSLITEDRRIEIMTGVLK